MSLPENYTQKPGAIPTYFDAILDAQPPERFSLKYLENLGFLSTNDRMFIGILKELGFLNADGVPQARYFEFMDRSRSAQVLAVGIREAYSDLFAVNTKANELSASDIKNKLRTLYAGKKTDNLIDRIAKTFTGLCERADFSHSQASIVGNSNMEDTVEKTEHHAKIKKDSGVNRIAQAISLESLQYHINIVLPETRDQAVHDAIFGSLRDHLGTRNG